MASTMNERRQQGLLTDGARAGVAASPQIYDEMVDGGGKVRAHWRTLMGTLALDPEMLNQRWDEGLLLLRQNGVTFNFYGDPQGIERLWPLDMIPLIIADDEWEVIKAGAIQRATLLNHVLADLYGPQTLIRSGRLPASLIHADPGFRRSCHGLRVPGGTWLHLCAIDLGRSPDGTWWVLGDSTEIPSGCGYALENRSVISRILPESFRQCQVAPLSGFFDRLRQTLLTLAPWTASPRAVLLSPGPYNETYFEHVFLARYLGLTLVVGEDLTVRDRRVFLKTLGGLEPVDVILRRLVDDYCDPLELKADSALGVAGLLQAVRAGTVAVANAIGAGLIESFSFKAFLPTLSRHFLGEELRLPCVATWWCGQEAELGFVIDNLERLVIKPAHRGFSLEPIFGGNLSPKERERLIGRLKRRPWDFVGQEQITLSTAPVREHGRLEPRPLVLRVFVAATPNGYRVMPGGLCRFSSQPDRLSISLQSGGGSKDTWVLARRGTADTAVPRIASANDPRGPEPARPEPPRSTTSTADLPSRVADGLYWLGRYAERLEGVVRLLRAVHLRLTDGAHPGAAAELVPLFRLMVWQSLTPPEVLHAPHLVPLRATRQALRATVFDPDHPNSVRANVRRLHRAAHSVRDRLALDMWRVITQIERLSNPSQRIDIAGTLLLLDDIITSLAALAGLEQENMTRGPGWRFLDLGRRLERALHLISLVRGIRLAESDPLDEHRVVPILEVLLELGESVMTYRWLHFTPPRTAPVLDLLLLDESNPRSLRFQLSAMSEHLQALPEMPGPALASHAPAVAARAVVDHAIGSLLSPDFTNRLEGLGPALSHLSTALPEVSNLMAHAYFSHAFARSA